MWNSTIVIVEFTYVSFHLYVWVSRLKICVVGL